MCLNVLPISDKQCLTLCVAGDVYTGNVSLTDRGDVCEKWSSQKLIKLNEPIDHNFCR